MAKCSNKSLNKTKREDACFTAAASLGFVCNNREMAQECVRNFKEAIDSACVVAKGPDCIRKRCDQGSAAACFLEGTTAALLEKDFFLACTRWATACEKGLAAACVYRAGCSGRGSGGLPVDMEQYAHWLKKGCDGGDGQACYYLGEHTAGKDTPTSQAVVALFEKGCKAAYPASCRAWVVCLAKATSSETGKIGGVLDIMLGYCRNGSMDACYQYGEALWYGQGIAQNRAAACTYYVKACELGDCQACNTAYDQYWMDECHLNGKAEARKVAQAACTMGCPYSCVRYAAILHGGEVGGMDRAGAVELLKKNCQSYSDPICEQARSGGLPTSDTGKASGQAEGLEQPADGGCFFDVGCQLGWCKPDRRDPSTGRLAGKCEYIDGKIWPYGRCDPSASSSEQRCKSGAGCVDLNGVFVCAEYCDPKAPDRCIGDDIGCLASKGGEIGVCALECSSGTQCFAIGLGLNGVGDKADYKKFYPSFVPVRDYYIKKACLLGLKAACDSL